MQVCHLRCVGKVIMLQVLLQWRLHICDGSASIITEMKGNTYRWSGLSIHMASPCISDASSLAFPYWKPSSSGICVAAVRSCIKAALVMCRADVQTCTRLLA